MASSINLPTLESIHLNELTGHFHCHITVLEDDLEKAKHLRWKPTVIDLSHNERTQQDIMLTKHFRDDEPGAVRRITDEVWEDVKELSELGFEVLRVKLEYEPEFFPECLRPTAEKYHELHFKCLGDEESFLAAGNITLFGVELRQSRNPYNKTPYKLEKFFNARVYGGTLESLARFKLKAVELLEELFDLKEMKHEVILFDTNHEHDNWWA